MKKGFWKSSLALSIIGLFIGVFVGLFLSFLAGENPLSVAKIILKSAFGSKYDIGVTLYYTTPLIFTGLSVAIAFHAGLFNIGAEGQLNIAALAVAIFGANFLVSQYFAPVLVILISVFAGGIWGWIAGWLKARRKAHEVINTIMLNFISAALISWLVSHFFQSTTTQNPETNKILAVYQWREWDPIAKFFADSPVSCALLLAIFCAIALWVFLWRTKWGFELRAVGENETASGLSGIDVSFIQQLALSLAGALAGLVAVGEVFGNAYRYRVGFSPDFGFLGIAVALLARNNPLGIIFSAFLFASLHKGAADLDIETDFITRDLSIVIQAVIIFSVSIFSSTLGEKK